MIALLGTNQALALAELEAVLSRQGLPVAFKLIGKDMVEFVEDSVDPQHLIDQLGGTVKLLLPLEGDGLIEAIVNDLTLRADGRVRYCVSALGETPPVEEVCLGVKKALASSKVPSRYRIPDSPRSSAGVEKRWHDFVLYSQDGIDKVAKTIAVQDINRWSYKDYQRPASDPRSGMLPPKVSRMMIQIALGSAKEDLAKQTILDPFCGSGTILLEGLDLGMNVVGSDISARAVRDSQQNCGWFVMSEPEGKGSWRVLQRDVMDVTKADFEGKPLDAIVFEGYLGPPNIQDDKIVDMHKGLGKLYIGTLKRLRSLVLPGTRIVCALPRYTLGSRVKSFDKLIDSCEKYGYTSRVGPFVYGRDRAKVKRSIYVFEAV